MLCSPGAPNLQQHAIIFAQGLAFSPTDASFTHAGIYVGNGMVVDSTKATNISERPYLDMASTSYVRALRYPGISSSLQQALCVEARTLTGKYALAKALVDGMLAVAGGNSWILSAIKGKLMLASQPVSDPAEAPFYCSELVNQVYINVLAYSVVGIGIPAAVPAAFAARMVLQPVTLVW